MLDWYQLWSNRLYCPVDVLVSCFFVFVCVFIVRVNLSVVVVVVTNTSWTLQYRSHKLM